MSDHPQYIAKPPVLKPAEDFYRLRQEGISFIEEMGSQLWTDYNAHDPGITILEAFCYAITELGYRTGWDIKDLLTPDPAEKKAAPPSKPQASDEQENSSFFRAGQILPVNPVTPDDFRRLLIGLDGIRNAWITAVECELSSSEYFDCCEKQEKNQKEEDNANDTENDPPVCGLYDVLLELETDPEHGDLSIRKVEGSFKGNSIRVELRFPELITVCSKEKESCVDWRSLLTDFIPFKVETIDLNNSKKCTDENSSSFKLDVNKTIDIGAEIAFQYKPTVTGNKDNVTTDTKTIYIKNIELFLSSGKDEPVEFNEKKCKTIKTLLLNLFKKERKRVLTIENAKNTLQSHRNLCEDYCSVKTVKTENVAVCAKIELRPDADIELVQAHVMHEIEKYFSPPIPFHSLQELLNAGERVEDIFNGPTPTGGFIKAADLEAASLKDVLNVSDLINILMDIDGIITIHHPKLMKYDDKGNIEKNKNPWRMSLSRQHKPKLYRAKNHITFYKNGVPFQEDFRDCDDMVNQLSGETERSRDETAKKDEPPDLPVPTGTFRNLNQYFPVQYSLPTAYGIGPDGLPAQASTEHRAKAKQLQGYLMAFEQILANSFSQLEHVGDLFSLDPKKKDTYFVNELDETILRGIDEIFRPIEETLENSHADSQEDDCELPCEVGPDDCPAYCGSPCEVRQDDCPAYNKQETDSLSCRHYCLLKQNSATQSRTEDSTLKYAQKAVKEILPEGKQLERRNRFLDHLMARFGEQFGEQALLFQEQRKTQQEQRITTQDLIEDKVSFIKQYKESGRDRGKAFDYTACSSENVSGLQKKITSMLALGYPDLSFIPDSTDATSCVCEGLNVRFTLRDANDNIWLQGCITIPSATEDQAYAAAEKRLMEEMIYTKSYKIIYEEDNVTGKCNFFLKLPLQLGNTAICQVCKHPDPFKSRAEAENFRDKLIGWGIQGRAVIVEHILLRPQSSNESLPPLCSGEKEQGSEKKDHYSFRMTVVMPGCGAPYNTNVAMRNYAERVIREETPTHLFVNILWVKNDSFDAFAAAWHCWLKTNAQVDCTRENSEQYADVATDSQKALSCRRSDIIEQLNKLRNTYPPARLHNREGNRNGDDQNPVRLGETSLGGCTGEELI